MAGNLILEKAGKDYKLGESECAAHPQRATVADEIQKHPQEEANMSGHDEHHDDPHGYGHDEPDVAAKIGIIFICVAAALYLISRF